MVYRRAGNGMNPIVGRVRDSRKVINFGCNFIRTGSIPVLYAEGRLTVGRAEFIHGFLGTRLQHAHSEQRQQDCRAQEPSEPQQVGDFAKREQTDMQE
jgi:hypothetical protein